MASGGLPGNGDRAVINMWRDSFSVANAGLKGPRHSTIAHYVGFSPNSMV